MAQEINLVKRYFNGIEDVNNAIRGVMLNGVQLNRYTASGEFVYALSPNMTYTYGKLYATL